MKIKEEKKKIALVFQSHSQGIAEVNDPRKKNLEKEEKEEKKETVRPLVLVPEMNL